jgi:hypothetical protein
VEYRSFQTAPVVCLPRAASRTSKLGLAVPQHFHVKGVDQAVLVEGGAGKDVVAHVVLRFLLGVAPKSSAAASPGPPPPTRLILSCDSICRMVFFGKQANDQLVDGRFTSLGALGELATRDAFSGDVAAYRLHDTLAVSFRDWHGAPIEPIGACGTTIMAGSGAVCYR